MPETDAPPVELDLSGLKCPLPVLRTRRALRALAPGAWLCVTCTDPLSGLDIPNLVREEGDRLEGQACERGAFRFLIRRAGGRVREETEMAPAIRATRLIHDGWSTFRVAEVSLPNGETARREIEDHGRAVSVLPYDPERRVALLIRQFRTPLFYADGTPDLLEAPAGLLDEPDPAEGARREAWEEAGVRLARLDPIASVWSMPGISTERMDLFLAPYREADRSGAGGGLAEEGEDIAVVEMPLAELAAMSDRGALHDVKTLTMVLALRLRHPELFTRDGSARSER